MPTSRGSEGGERREETAEERRGGERKGWEVPPGSVNSAPGCRGARIVSGELGCGLGPLGCTKRNGLMPTPELVAV